MEHVIERAAIVLGGGRSTRMGMDKLTLQIDGESLLERAVAAALGWAEQAVVAGDEPEGWQQRAAVRFRREDPPFGGPAAGIAAALALLPDADQILILAGDLANPLETVATLAAAEPGPDGVVLQDTEGWPQYLAGRYRAAALRDAVNVLRSPTASSAARGYSQAPHHDVAGAGTAGCGARAALNGVSVRRLMRTLDVARHPAPEAVLHDLDNPEVAKMAGANRPNLRK